MNFIPENVTLDVPGVLAAKQKRSIEMRDAYLNAGILLLNDRRFHELRVPDLAEHCGYSVGGFYTRFEDKDAFFKAMQLAVNMTYREMAAKRFELARLKELPLGTALDDIVDFMTDIFTGPGKGVLRETLLRITEASDPWAPMRETREITLGYIKKGLDGHFPDIPTKETGRMLSFSFQAIVGILQNDLLNAHHIHSTRDDSLRKELKVLVRRYLGVKDA